MDTVLFLCSLVACLIGVLTFISGLNNRAKGDGVVLQKIEQAIAGIEDLKKEVHQQGSNHQALALTVQAHGEQIRTLFREFDEVNKTTQALVAILDAIKRLEEHLDNRS